MPQPILEARSLVKKFGTLIAVNDVSFAIEEGEIFGLLGPGGAGKSTLTDMLTGLFPPDSGAISILGCDAVADLEQVKPLISVVPQELALYPSLSGQDNLRFFGEMYGLGGRRLNERVNSALGYMALTERAKDKVQTYTTGMKRRLSLAVGTLNNPRLLFLDEPTEGADAQSRGLILESIERLNREHHLAVLYATRHAEEAERLCQRVALMDNGKIIALDTPRNLIAQLGGGIVIVETAQADENLVAQVCQLSQVRAACLLTPSSSEEGQPVSVAQTLKVEAHQPEEVIIQIFQMFREQNREILAIKTLMPNLESVYLHLTGKTLRS